MSEYTPPYEDCQHELNTKPWPLPTVWKPLLPDLWAGRTSIEYVIMEIKKRLREEWPTQCEARQAQLAIEQEHQREQREMRENEGRSEPIIVWLPKPDATISTGASASAC